MARGIRILALMELIVNMEQFAAVRELAELYNARYLSLDEYRDKLAALGLPVELIEEAGRACSCCQLIVRD